MATVLVCGGRLYSDRPRVMAELDALHAKEPFTKLVHGAANGADEHAGWWALCRGVPVATYPAEWRKYGRAAGPIRNRKMLAVESPQLVVAFPGGTGTADMVRQAKAAGIRVVEIAP